MGQITLVRHAQASLGADNYDRLSPLGLKQSLRLGQYFKECGCEFEAAYCGTLSRQVDTLSQIYKGLQVSGATFEQNSAFNEYNSHAVMRCALKPNMPLPSPLTKEGYREFFQLLRLGLSLWMSGQSQPQGLPSFSQFVSQVMEPLHRIMMHHNGRVLVVSSGGPISFVIAKLLEVSDSARIELNLSIRNTAISELLYTQQKISVLSFNNLPHLSTPPFQDWVSYA
jgi:broad specificity phosphatase PhoE